MKVLQMLTAWIKSWHTTWDTSSHLSIITSSIQKYRKPALVGACSLLILSALLALLAPGRAAEYQSIALLLYAGNAATAPGAPPLSAADAARARFDDAQLLNVIHQFDLYPELRQTSSDEALEHMRDRMSLLEPDSYSLQIAFRDDSSERSQEVANALAEVLQTDVLARADIAPPVPVAPRNHRRHSPDSAHVATPADETRRQLARVDAQFLPLTQRQSELEEKSAETQRQIAAAGTRNTTPKTAEAEPPVDPYAGTRLVLKEQLAAEKQQLAALLERYTEAYPDVIDAHAKISQLEAKLAELPPPPAARHVRALNLYQKQVDDLTAEESQIGEQLRINEREMSKLERRREDLSAQLHRLGGAGSPASPPPNIVASVPVGALPSGQQIRPFHILQSATMSVVVGTVKAGRFTPAVISMAGIGLVSLLFLFLVPRIPWNDMVITTAEELRKSLPAHVLYLGHVKGSEH